MNIEKQYKRWLSTLIKQVEMHLADIDKIMEMPESKQRGQLIAKSCNNLDLVKDTAKLRLGLPLKRKSGS